jgi:hypothetical protein
MTVLPFTTRASARDDDVGVAAAPDLTGHFTPPGGGDGLFTGTYRLERLLDQYGQTAAAGVFTGELIGADRRRIGLASRRHVAAAEVLDDAHGRWVSLGPVDVNLLGFLVTVDAFAVRVPLDLPALGGTWYPRSAAELLGLVVDRTGRQHPADGPRHDPGS